MSENSNGDSMCERFLVAFAAEGRSWLTIRAYRNVICQWESTGLGAREYLAGLEGKVQPSTRWQRGMVLRRYLRWAAEEGLIDANPLVGAKLRQPPLKPIRPFSGVELEAMIAACQTVRERAIILVLAETGLRAGELRLLKWADVDMEREFTLRVEGKGGKSRLVALGDASAAALTELRRVDGTTERVFPFCHEVLAYYLRRIAKRAGVSGVHAHRFRHSFANTFLELGGDFGDLRVLLGHANWEMTQHYVAFHEGERALAAHRRLFSRGIGIPPRTRALNPSESSPVIAGGVPGGRARAMAC